MMLSTSCLRGRPRGLDSGSRSGFPAYPLLCAVAGLTLVFGVELAQAKPNPSNVNKPPAKKGDCGSKGVRKGRIPGVDLLPAAPGARAPKWQCETQELELEPVWQGEQLTCSFKIKNAGGGTLNMKASAG